VKTDTGDDGLPVIHLGIDDTDSREGMCTTYLLYLLVDRLLRKGVVIEDYPHLIRLNPNIPWKTRGNGAVALTLRAEDPEDIFDTASSMIEEHSEAGVGRADPGLILSDFKSIPREILEFASDALSDVVSIREALSLIRRYDLRFKGWGSRRGLIGALAAVGCSLDADSTYELIAFRAHEHWGSRRLVDPESVVEMSRNTYPYTFNNYDEETGRVLLTPRGPDPVLLGVRGESPELLLKAFKMLRIYEPVNGYMIFKTNQGTSVHLKRRLNLGDLKAYRSGFAECTVSSRPRVEEGGHVYFDVDDDQGTVTCAAYEPTGDFRKTALSLIPGDRIEVGGGVRRRSRIHPAVLNLEYIRILKPARDIKLSNPLCPSCGRRMSSQGRGQGFRCSRCGFTDRYATKIREEVPRCLERGLYLPPPRAQRHLTKPLQRYRLSHQIVGEMVPGWFKPPLEEVELNV